MTSRRYGECWPFPCSAMHEPGVMDPGEECGCGCHTPPRKPRKRRYVRRAKRRNAA